MMKVLCPNVMVLLIVAFRSAFVTSTTRIPNCPLRCICKRWADGGVDVRCKGSYLTAIPAFPTNATKLFVSVNNITVISNFAFPHQLRLADIYFWDKNTQTIEEYGFHGLQSLSKLHLSTPLVTDLRDHVFDPIYNLRIMQLSMSLKSVPPKNICACSKFRHLIHLTSIQMQSCSLSDESVARNAFSPMSKLEAVVLDNNQLTNFTRMGISKTVEHISLRGNAIRGIYQYTFTGYDQVKLLDLSYNPIRTISQTALCPMAHLEKLYLVRTRLVFIGEIFRCTGSLKQLVLSENNLQNGIAEDIFSNLSQLEGLNLNGNIVFGRSVDLHNIFHTNAQLTELSLTNCGIPNLPDRVFANLHNLVKLELADNSITSWSSDVFRNLTKLEILSLSRNKIVTITKNSLQFWNDLQILALADNPFVCDCDLVWFRQWLLSRNTFVSNIGLQRYYSCSSPIERKGQKLIDFNLSANDCISEADIKLAFSVIMAFVAVIIIGAVSFRFRWYVTYLCFLIKSRRKRWKELANQAEYEFDAFVGYNSRDRHWVIQELLPELETRGGYRLCLHHRDWLAGPDIAENIVESIERSRKTILVISNRFTKSHWCQVEMAFAQARLQCDLIPILLEDIAIESMSAGLRCLLTSKTYLAWPSETRQKKRFWKALRKALQLPQEKNI